MKNLIKRLFLLHGQSQERLALLSLYAVVGFYLVVFWHFFSLPPGPASWMQDRMMRITVFLGLYLAPLFFLAAGSWLAALLISIVKAIRARAVSVSTLPTLCISPAGFLVIREIYRAFLRGHGTAIHQWLYNL
jgi:hypothetical protein